MVPNVPRPAHVDSNLPQNPSGAWETLSSLQPSSQGPGLCLSGLTVPPGTSWGRKETLHKKPSSPASASRVQGPCSSPCGPAPSRRPRSLGHLHAGKSSNHYWAVPSTAQLSSECASEAGAKNPGSRPLATTPPRKSVQRRVAVERPERGPRPPSAPASPADSQDLPGRRGSLSLSHRLGHTPHTLRLAGTQTGHERRSGTRLLLPEAAQVGGLF